jgi:hypothetical protein
MRFATSGPDKAGFGEAVLGPIFADFSLRLWTLLKGIDQPQDMALLFCARGGLRLKLIYDHFLAAGGLTSPVVTRNFMISRIVALRTALLGGHSSAFDQIGYEMRASSLADVARAISGLDPAATDTIRMSDGDSVYTPAGLARLLASDEGRPIQASLENQAGLFFEHLQSCLGGRRRAILCDSGLAGSTMQLLEDGIPDIMWRCALFARSNYKGLATPHFARTVGLAVEAKRYSPLDARTAVLRYWHLMEAILEPELQSVSTFKRVDGVVRSNLEVHGWKQRIGPRRDEFLAGILVYIDALPAAGAATRIIKDVKPAYRELRRAIIWPNPQDVDMLSIGERSIDFGRTDNITTFSGKAGLRGALWGNLWREGAIASQLSPLHRPVLAGIEVAYSTRWAARALKLVFR